jgi:hypothetical protein
MVPPTSGSKRTPNPEPPNLEPPNLELRTVNTEPNLKMNTN